MAHQVHDEGELPARELDRPVAPPRAVGQQVDAEIPELQLARQLLVGAPSEREDAGAQLLEGERFEHVVIGSALERLHLAVEAVARGEHDHRQLRSIDADPREDVLPVEARKGQVEDDKLDRIVERGEHALVSVGHTLDRVARRGEAPFEESDDPRVVLDDEDSHMVEYRTQTLCDVGA